MSHPASRTTVSEGDHTFRFSKTNGVWVGAVVVSMIVRFTIKTVLACRTFPNGMFGLKLSTETAAVGEWEGAAGATGRCFFVMVLGHSEPLEAMIASVFYGRS